MLRKLAALLLCAMAIPAALAQQTPPPPPAGGGGALAGTPGLPGNLFTSARKVALSTLKREWVHIPMGRGALRTLIVHPAGNSPAPVVMLLHYDAGLDSLQQSMAVQLAERGFIAVAPDLLSGLGPDGGHYDSFRFPDAAMRAVLSMNPAEAMRRYKIAHAYVNTLPRGNGSIAALGAGIGGTHSFRLATEVPDLSAAVVFYGLPPAARALRNVNSPVLGLYGEDDPEVIATLGPTEAAMKQSGKVYETRVYPGATHSFLSYVLEGRNGEATASAWPAAMEFLNQHSKQSGR